MKLCDVPGPGVPLRPAPQCAAQVRLDPATGLLYGGSPSNCGTWMDKMGESPEHGTDGVPGTPRDGAAVEITGLLYSTLDWLTTLGERLLYCAAPPSHHHHHHLHHPPSPHTHTQSRTPSTAVWCQGV